ncbi:MBL fold metallo-hydrolase [Cohnella nanjingensis]|uniref:MBL fold metallo-hydrolase n=1 Tax=Cohnella nanjingensis TaxID=1387779 RepID=A0A7X0RSE1_9BACL|nr:MBL fold metallo-hydrolase [Cohnella nanjingensis]MBB6672695.1 MBL fold metallo-hydrolase [Cohnella nanjingensis]
MRIYKTDSVAVFQSEFYMMNAIVIHTRDLVLVVDPGYLPSEVREVRAYVDEVKEDKPVFVFYTHSDYDHIAGYGAFREEVTVAGQAFAETTDPRAAVDEVERHDDRFYISRPYAHAYPKADYIVRKEGEAIAVGGTSLQFYRAHGHNPDGLMCLVEPLGLLIVGDYLSDVEFPFVFDSFANYRATLERFKQVIEAREGLLLLPGHGSPTGEAGELRLRLGESERYLDLVDRLAESPDEAAFEAYMARNGYAFKRGLRERHAENVKKRIAERAEAESR